MRQNSIFAKPYPLPTNMKEESILGHLYFKSSAHTSVSRAQLERTRGEQVSPSTHCTAGRGQHHLCSSKTLSLHSQLQIARFATPPALVLELVTTSRFLCSTQSPCFWQLLISSDSSNVFMQKAD